MKYTSGNGRKQISWNGVAKSWCFYLKGNGYQRLGLDESCFVHRGNTMSCSPLQLAKYFLIKPSIKFPAKGTNEGILITARMKIQRSHH